jgi:hypothetical protein
MLDAYGRLDEPKIVPFLVAQDVYDEIRRLTGCPSVRSAVLRWR